MRDRVLSNFTFRLKQQFQILNSNRISRAQSRIYIFCILVNFRFSKQSGERLHAETGPGLERRWSNSLQMIITEEDLQVSPRWNSRVSWPNLSLSNNHYLLTRYTTMAQHVSLNELGFNERADRFFFFMEQFRKHCL